jgi:CRP/FNR family transcriptional regulator, cyclic AMP receptor protein
MVADIVREQVYETNEIIIEKGDVGNSMFIIAAGEVEIYLPEPNHQRLTVMEESEFFGEMALFGEDVRSASARALKPTKLLCLEREHFLNLIYEKPEISIEIIKVLSDRLRRMGKRASETEPVK